MVHITENTLQDTMQDIIELKQLRIQHWERDHAAFRSMRPWIRRAAWLPSMDHVRNAQVTQVTKYIP